MIRNKGLPFFDIYKILLFIFISCFISFSVKTFAQSKSTKKQKKLHLDIDAGLNTSYDDNILKYSEKYLDRFLNNEDEGRFHIETYDDVIINPSISATMTYKLFGNLNSKIIGKFNRRLYVINNIKNWDYFSLGFRQYLSKRLSFKIYYSYIPEFYIRHFRDDEWVDVYGYTSETFKPMLFSKDNYGIWIQNTFFKNTRVRLTMSYAKYFHNSHYTEYDSKNFVYAGKIYQPLHKKFAFELGYQYITSDAKGYDELHETKENSNNSDATYIEERFIIGFVWKLPKIFKLYHDLDVEGQIQNRYYSSQHYLEEDRIHAGRFDNNYRLYFTYNLKPYKNFKTSLFYNWLYRDSDTEALVNKEYLSDEKDYLQNQFGVKLAYTIKL